jgi:hypothetical protein
VTREEGGDFQAKFIEGPPSNSVGVILDLTCWSDVPCTTPGEALERIGKQLDAELMAFACDSMKETSDVE